MSGTPRRRWYQFSLGTMLLLVTLFAVWMAGDLRIIRERQSWLRGHTSVVDETNPHATIPLHRRVLGDKPVDLLLLPANTGDGDRAGQGDVSRSEGLENESGPRTHDALIRGLTAAASTTTLMRAHPAVTRTTAARAESHSPRRP